jgi:hypothetical protein
MSRYTETAIELTNGLSSLLSVLTLSKFVKWIITIIITTLIVLFIYENFFSSNFYYGRIERKLDIIERAKRISSNDSLINKLANKKILEVLNHLDPPRHQNFEFRSYDLSFFGNIQNNMVKVLGALVLPFLIAFASRKEPNSKNTTTGSLAMFIFFGVVAVLIPTIYSPWFNFFLIILIEVIILVPIAIWYNKAKARETR